jgi:hypothetical protein
MSRSGAVGVAAALILMQSRHVSGRQARRDATASSSLVFDFV